ncbi:iron-containing alcohol dehydrogenase [Moorella naiadis]|uniref:iron-containing alcohol dehydrogenase n=1 Tax=Moorella naiadis (nom. illeg.) TaxID=3093670 RepID=UPI003D9CBA75
MLNNIMKGFNFVCPTQVVFGPGKASTVGIEIKRINGHKVFLCTDAGIIKAGLLDRVLDSLRASDLATVIFDAIQTNPTIEIIEQGYDLFKAEECDALVAVGGGSSIDTGKAIGLLSTNPAPLSQYEGADKVPNAIPPLIAIPTAAGTGAEVTFSSVITDVQRNYKISIRSPLLAPRVALLDPEMLVSLPPHIAAATGMDTLTHAIEAYTSTAGTVLTDTLALEAIKLTAEYLPQFYANRKNLEAAAAMQHACVWAAIAFANGRLGNVHAMAHPLGGHFNVHHGVACAIVLPRVMEFSLAGAPRKYAEVARVMGEVVDGLSLMAAAARAPEAVYQLSRQIGIPAGLTQVGVTEERIPAMAQDAVASGIHTTNPRQSNLEDIIALYKACM